MWNEIVNITCRIDKHTDVNHIKIIRTSNVENVIYVGVC